MKKLLTIIAVMMGVLLALPANASARRVGGDSSITLANGRTYMLHIPNPLPAGPAPLIVALHGLNGSPAALETNMGLSTFGDNHGVYVAYGASTTTNGYRVWNAGACCESAAGDDVSYITQLVNDVSLRANIAPTKRYLWGFSNGGMMAWRYLCERPGVFASGGSVAGTLTPGGKFDCSNTTVKMKHLYGGNDTTVPPNGGYRAFCPCTFPPASTEASNVGPNSIVSEQLVPSGDHSWPLATNNWGVWGNGILWDFANS